MDNKSSREMSGTKLQLVEHVHYRISRIDIKGKYTYKEKYEALSYLIEPFKDQLESFEMERDALLARNKEAEGEVKKLATQYGQLLGHQNHKQKIQHSVKLKKENVTRIF